MGRNGRTEKMLDEVKKYLAENPDDRVYLITHGMRYSKYLADTIKRDTGKDVVPLGPGMDDRLWGAVGKAFIDHHFHDARMSHFDYFGMIDAVDSMEKRTNRV